MQISMICCPFKTSYGNYASGLIRAIEKKTGSTVKWVASNCGCGDAVETRRDFQTDQCDYFEMPIPGEYRSASAWKRPFRKIARSSILYIRAKRYASRSRNSEIVHFQQILNAFGSTVVFHWLQQPSPATKIVTVHELDREQSESPEKNRLYNLADALIVHCEDMKKRLVDLKVQEDKIHVVLHGVTIPDSISNEHREAIVFYAGHKPMTGKGMQNLFKAMSIVQERLREATPMLKIHGHYGETTPEAGKKLAEEHGIANRVLWLNQLSMNDVVNVYQRSILLTLPYTGSFAGLPASLAAANQLPIICTRKAGLPDHLGDSPVWIDPENSEQLTQSILDLLSNPQRRREIAMRQLNRAKNHVRWEVIGEQTVAIYQEAMKRKIKPGSLTEVSNEKVTVA
jgi:glycosyltransferase involved in cell wall biosynthesis